MRTQGDLEVASQLDSPDLGLRMRCTLDMELRTATKVILYHKNWETDGLARSVQGLA